MNDFTPAYLALLGSGELARRVEAADEHLSACDLCAWECGVDRRAGKLGVCKTGAAACVSSAFPHLGEEACLRGWCGSGTIFFTGCNMRCQFCQNFEISAQHVGCVTRPEDIARMMLDLQAQGCHNINFVSPSHVVAPILAAVLIAAQAGLRLPLVYNSGGYDSPAALALLDGVIDIYMPDAKYADAAIARRYSKISDYPARNRAALREMHRQVGDLQIDPQTGLAQRGLLVRHLVLPAGLAGTPEVMRFLAEQLSPDTYVNVMGQYHPYYHAAREAGPLSRGLSLAEYTQARHAAHAAGLRRLD